MNNQELNSRTMETAKSSGLHGRRSAGKTDQRFFAGQSTRSLGHCGGPYSFGVLTSNLIWLAVAAGFLLFTGVVRAQQYSFQNIAFPGDTFTQLLSINDGNVIAGYHGMDINKGFTLTLPNLTFTSENFPGSAQTQVTGINNAGETSGFYIDAGGTNHGFLDNNGLFTTVDFPNTTFNQLLGLNNNGQSAGYFQDPNGFQHPYILQPGGTFNLLGQFIPGGASAQATDINDNGQVTGFYATAGGDNGFLWTAGKLMTLSVPGAAITEALGLNNLGQVVGFYQNTLSSNMQGFIYSGGVFTTVDDPGAINTTINGINNFGQIVGFALVGDQTSTVGFVGSPIAVPEPSLLSLLALGSTSLIGMCLLRRRRSFR
jgi:probable HAF family extracellular repeat protein